MKGVPSALQTGLNAGRNPHFEARKDMAEIRGLARTEQAPAPRPGDFVATETAAAIMGTLNLIRTLDGGGVTTIAGASGIGKTTTPLDFAAGSGRDAIHLRIAKGEGRPFCIACSIFAARGWGASSGPRAQDEFAAEDWREYLAQVSGAGMMTSSSRAAG